MQFYNVTLLVASRVSLIEKIADSQFDFRKGNATLGNF